MDTEERAWMRTWWWPTLQPHHICIDARDWSSAPRLRNPERHYANNPGRHRASRDWLTLTPALPQPRPLRCPEPTDSALEKPPGTPAPAARHTDSSRRGSPVPASGVQCLDPLRGSPESGLCINCRLDPTVRFAPESGAGADGRGGGLWHEAGLTARRRGLATGEVDSHP